MIKKQQKWIAVLVTLTFMWLLQVSTMPVAAAGTTEQISSASAEQGPRYIEEAGGSRAKAKKKSPLPYILIGVGLVTVTAVVLFLFVLKGYDITGEWLMTRGTSPRYLTFSGDKKAGSVRIDFDTWGSSAYGTDSGTYTVDGKAVIFSQYWPSNPNSYEYNYVGNFTGKDTMSGTFTMSKGGPDSGSWSATRNSATASAPKETVAKTEDQSADAKRRQQR
jgi:hypothetical protein